MLGPPMREEEKTSAEGVRSKLPHCPAVTAEEAEKNRYLIAK